MARRIYKFVEFRCEHGHKTHKFAEAGTLLVKCETCGEPAILPAVATQVAAGIRVDSLDYIDHNLGREPVHITSHAQRRALMAAGGLVEFIRHTPVPGTDKSPHTTDWSKGSIDPYTLESARILVSRQGGKHEETEEEAPVANMFSHTASPADVRELVKIINKE
jgi:hypothetical protein